MCPSSSLSNLFRRSSPLLVCILYPHHHIFLLTISIYAEILEKGTSYSNTSSSNLWITRPQSQLTLNNNQIGRQQQFCLIDHQSSFTSRKKSPSSSQVLVVPSSCTLVFAQSPSSQPSSQCLRQRCYILIIQIAGVIFTFTPITIMCCLIGCPKKSKSPNFGMPLTPVVFIG